MLGRAQSNETDGAKLNISRAQCSIFFPAFENPGQNMILFESHGHSPTLVRRRCIRVFSPVRVHMSLTARGSAGSISGCRTETLCTLSFILMITTRTSL